MWPRWQGLTDCRKGIQAYRDNLEWYKAEIGKCTNREFTTGFFFGKPGSDAQIYKSSTYVKNYTYLGTIEKVDQRGFGRIQQKNKFSVGEIIEVMKPDGRNLQTEVKGLWNEEGIRQESAPHARQILDVELGVPLEEFDILRRKEDEG